MNALGAQETAKPTTEENSNKQNHRKMLMNKKEYEKVIQEDKEYLAKCPPCLERQHIIDVLDASIANNYDESGNFRPKGEQVNHPSHYTQYPVEVIDMMRGIFGDCATALWCTMTAFKYRMRLGHKDNIQQELQKEEWYLTKAKALNNLMGSPKELRGSADGFHLWHVKEEIIRQTSPEALATRKLKAIENAITTAGNALEAQAQILHILGLNVHQ